MNILKTFRKPYFSIFLASLCLIIKSQMTKKITLLALFFVNLLTVNAQEKVLLVGFSDDNFLSEWKPIEKLAKKNSTTVEKVDDLYRSSLINAMATISQEFDYVKGDDTDIDLLSSNKYSTLNNKKSKEYYGYNPKQGIGFTGGWGAPYGFGIEYSYLVTQKLDLNAGFGFSFSGLRAGIGTRYFFNEGSSPFAGANFIYSSGLSGLDVSTSNGTGKYKIESDQAFFIRGGYKIEHNNKLFFINLGYGIPFDPKDAIWQSGEESSSQQDLANLMRLGGVEISGSIVFRIGK